jgi:hypothetical protein
MAEFTQKLRLLISFLANKVTAFHCHQYAYLQHKVDCVEVTEMRFILH